MHFSNNNSSVQLTLSVLLYLPWVSCPLPLQLLEEEEEEEKNSPLLNSRHTFSSLFLSAQSLPAPPPSPTWTRSPRTRWTCPGTDPPTTAAPSWRATSWKRRRRGKSGWSAHMSPPQPPTPPSRGWWRERSTSSVSWQRTRQVPAIPARQPTPSLPLTSLVSWLFCLVWGFLFLFEIFKRGLFVPYYLLILFLMKEDLLSNSNPQIF